MKCGAIFFTFVKAARKLCRGTSALANIILCTTVEKKIRHACLQGEGGGGGGGGGGSATEYSKHSYI